jgi:hypothetical protein
MIRVIISPLKKFNRKKNKVFKCKEKDSHARITLTICTNDYKFLLLFTEYFWVGYECFKTVPYSRPPSVWWNKILNPYP